MPENIILDILKNNSIILLSILSILRVFMYLDNPELQKQMAEATKQKWEKLVLGNKPYTCKKCGQLKDPKDFVIQRLDNYWVGKYRYLYECKACKKNRINKKRDKTRKPIE